MALDLLGAGETAAPEDASLAIGAQAELVAGFVDALGLERIILVGHDSGGSVARAFAIDCPEKVSQLVLADTDVPDHRPFLAPTILRLTSVPGSRQLLAPALRSRRLARLSFRPFFADLGNFDFAEFYDAVIAPAAHSKAGGDGVFRFLRNFDFGDVDRAQSGYGRLTMRKLVIWGQRDRAFPIAEGRRLAGLLPAPVEFEPVPDAGLLVHEEAPDAWTERVRRFIDAAG